MNEHASAVAETAHYLFERGLTHGRTGNIAIRTDDGILTTPTGRSLRDVTSDQLALVDANDQHLGGPKPTKESFLHTAILRARPDDNAVIHTHSPYSTALSCLQDVDSSDAIPCLSAYFAMKVGRVILLPYFAPGDNALTQAAESAAGESAALLLRNHGPIVAAPTMPEALERLEELEYTAQLALLLHGIPSSPLTAEQRRALSRP